MYSYADLKKELTELQLDPVELEILACEALLVERDFTDALQKLTLNDEFLWDTKVTLLRLEKLLGDFVIPKHTDNENWFSLLDHYKQEVKKLVHSLLQDVQSLILLRETESTVEQYSLFEKRCLPGPA